jgi:hypothetical protein
MDAYEVMCEDVYLESTSKRSAVAIRYRSTLQLGLNRVLGQAISHR